MKLGTKSGMMFLVIQTKTPTLLWADLQKSGYNWHQCRLSLRDLQPLQTDALVVNTLSCLPTLTYSKGQRRGRFSWNFPSIPSIHPSRHPSSLLLSASSSSGHMTELCTCWTFKATRFCLPTPPRPSLSLCVSYNLMWHHIIIFYNVKAEKLL